MRRIELNVHYSSEKHTWETPKDLFEKLGFKVSGMMPDYGFTIKLPPRRF